MVPDSTPIQDAKLVEPVKRLPLHKASLVKCHIEIGYRQRYGDGSCITRGMDSQIVTLKTDLL